MIPEQAHEDHYHLLTRIWELPEPELLISLHGSALLPELISGHIVAGHLKDEIYRTALSTKAWYHK